MYYAADKCTLVLPNNVIAFATSQFPYTTQHRAEQRWVMAWTTYYYYEEQDPETDPEAPLIVCASAGRNPLSLWTCWALASSPIYPPELFYTPTSGSFYVADYPQVCWRSRCAGGSWCVGRFALRCVFVQTHV